MYGVAPPRPPPHIVDMTSLTLIAAVSHNRMIGRDGALPWTLPADLQRFRALTLGKTLVMGRGTFDSIGRALPGRRNIVVTRQAGWCADGAEVAGSIEQALLMAGDAPVMVIGGGQIYDQTIALADRLAITWVHRAVDGDTRFPPIDLRTWHRVSTEVHDGYDFSDYVRRQPLDASVR